MCLLTLEALATRCSPSGRVAFPRKAMPLARAPAARPPCMARAAGRAADTNGQPDAMPCSRTHTRGVPPARRRAQATEPAKLLASAKCCLALAPLGGVLARATLAVFISLRDEHDHNFISFAKKNHSWAYYRTSDASSVDRGWPKIY